MPLISSGSSCSFHPPACFNLALSKGKPPTKLRDIDVPTHATIYTNPLKSIWNNWNLVQSPKNTRRNFKPLYAWTLFYRAFRITAFVGTENLIHTGRETRGATARKDGRGARVKQGQNDGRSRRNVRRSVARTSRTKFLHTTTMKMLKESTERSQDRVTNNRHEFDDIVPLTHDMNEPQDFQFHGCFPAVFVLRISRSYSCTDRWWLRWSWHVCVWS